MTLTVWFSFVVVCVLGTISPGPSLAVVLRRTLSNGRSHGLVTAASHSAGVTLWALLTVWGLGVVVTEHPMLYQIITGVGAVYLAWLGFKALRSSGNPQFSVEGKPGSLFGAVRDGAMISLMNPKLALFFIALFSQFVSAEQALTENLLMTATVVSIDLLWYCGVALLLSQERVIRALQEKTKVIDRVSGLVMIGLAVRVAL
ncbi:LysE family translocator [Neptuniibacter halophilus]|uniref:LysE family translocator n=1 Tax=Neptuniibacter halophilus TaxID=651666 RepID=UPI002572E469|nr:LysE family translocator [Neptuniibacter halophilus]